MGLVGDAWTMLILRELFYGETRFDHLVSSLGIARSTLTDRLRTLVDSGILTREIYRQNPARYKYLLTDKGQDLFGIIAALGAWGDRWMTDNQGAPVVLHHKKCGHDLDAAVVCRSCGEEVKREDVIAHPGPGYPESLKKSAAFTRRFVESPEIS